MKRTIPLLALLGGLLCACRREQPPSFRLADGKQPNLFLITIDTLRADHLGCYDSAAAGTSPSIDRLAGTGIVFEHAGTPVPATLPALASLLTGRYPGGHPVRTNQGRMPRDIPVLAELLAKAGYTTAAFYGNSLLADPSGFGRGFRSYTSFVPLGGAADPRGVEFARAWLESAPPQPWFLWLHFMDPHGPYDSAPASWSEGREHDALPDFELPFSPTNYGLGMIPRYQQLDDIHSARAYRARYRGEVHFTDAQVGRILTVVEELKLHDSTLTVLTADHGESLGEHNYYFQHGWFPYEESVRVPLIVRLPGAGIARRVAEPVSLVDVLPTVLGGLEIQVPEGAEGRDLRPALAGTAVPAAPIFAVTAYLNQMTAVRDGQWKLVHTPLAQAPLGGDPWAAFYASRQTYALFDLASDPGETKDLAGGNPARVGALRPQLLGWERQHGIPMDRTPASELDPTTRDRLGALGYGS